MKKFFLGVDPGINGAFSLLQGTKLVALHDMPVRERKGKREVCMAHVAGLVRTWCAEYLADAPADLVAGVEYVHAMPKQGVTSSFNFGKGYGIVLGALAMAGVEPVEVSSVAWKNHFELTGQHKRAALLLATELYPQHAEHFARGVHDGRADATLIARYTAEKHRRRYQ